MICMSWCRKFCKVVLLAEDVDRNHTGRRYGREMLWVVLLAEDVDRNLSSRAIT